MALRLGVDVGLNVGYKVFFVDGGVLGMALRLGVDVGLNVGYKVFFVDGVVLGMALRLGVDVGLNVGAEVGALAVSNVENLTGPSNTFTILGTFSICAYDFKASAKDPDVIEIFNFAANKMYEAPGKREENNELKKTL